jgi:methionyl-tRNA synthetase
VARVSNMIEKNGLELKLENDLPCDNKFIELINSLSLEDSLKYLWDNFRALDLELAEKQPWKIEVKDEIKKVLGPVAQKILSLSLLLFPFMPETSKKIVGQFSDAQIKKGESLFPRI